MSKAKYIARMVNSSGDITNTSLTNSLDLKSPLASPTFTGTVTGVSKSMVGLGNVDNTTDLLKPISTATQTALDLKSPLASPTFTGTVSGITKSMVGLGNVDNTTDANKPVSTATQTALDLKSPLASPTFTGTPSVPTATVGTNTTQIASTAYVRAEVSALVASAPTALDTLNELATALGNDANFSTTVTTALGLKAPLASPTFTGTVNTANLAYTGTLTGSTGVLNIGSGQVYKDASGNVGIGTSSPANKMDVLGGRLVNRSASTTSSATIEAQVNDYWSTPTYVGTSLSQNDLTTTGTTAGLTNASLGVLRFQNVTAGLIYTSNPTPLVFGTSAVERMRINSSGNVGIGTSSPSSKLDIGSSAGAGPLSTLTFSGLNSASTKTNYVQFVPAVEFAVAGSESGGFTLKTLQNGAYKDSIVAGGTLANASNYLSFGTTNPAMRIDSSGLLLINTTADTSSTFSPRVQVNAGSNSVTTIQGMPCGLLINNKYNGATTGQGISMKFQMSSAEVGKYAAIAGVGDSSYSNSMALAFYTTANATAGVDNVTERMRIDSSGNVTLQKNISVGAAAPTTSGTGITFPATQSASSDANTLDDYEEGAWSPTLTSSSGAITSYTAFGYYTKIGRIVSVQFQISITNIGTAAGSYLFVNSIPFTGSGGIQFQGTYRENAVNGFLGQVSLGTSQLTLLTYANGGVAVAGGVYIGNITYFV